MTGYNVLEQCLREGFIDYRVKADGRYVPRILTNNKERRVKVLDTILSQMDACDEFWFSVAFITKTGIACLKDKLINHPHIKGKILASQYLNFTEPNALRELLKFSNLEIRMVPEDQGFHAKGYLFHLPHNNSENYTMIVGSSNLTASALTTNQEWNVFFTSSEDGALIQQTHREFEQLWQVAECVTEQWIQSYEDVYVNNKPTQPHKIKHMYAITPNKMQQEALLGIENLRANGQDRGLLISATGTGKTFLSGFDVRKYQPKRFLFVIHREMIAADAKDSYERLDFPPEEMGLLSGNHKDTDKKYIFATMQTLSQDDVLHSFARDAFDYIVVDEVHHAGAPTYQKIFNYFKPKFWLGMTATPERSDDFDIYDLFNHNIAYEIRLHRALEEEMLVPFHYHGISEITVDGKLLDDHSDFNLLTCDARVDHILTYADVYGSDTERVKGLVFCSNVEEAKTLAEKFRERGRKALSLTGSNSEKEREAAVDRLEADAEKQSNYLDYIITVDIFNEGVDIPQVNQVIMLRPTQSAIVFVQQLGRGLRKYPNKRYLEVLDFIGNYENNFLLPIALYGDRTYNKDKVREIIQKNYLPGPSTVHFDDITAQRIYTAIDNRSQLADYAALKESYRNMKFRLGRQPMMMDFIHFGDKDPWLFIDKKESYYGFVQAVDHYESTLTKQHAAVLKMLSLELANGKRIEEIFVLKALLKERELSASDLSFAIERDYHYYVTDATIAGVANVLALGFFKPGAQKKYGNIVLAKYEQNTFTISDAFYELLKNEEFEKYVTDVLDYGEYRFKELFESQQFVHGFIRYGKYTRKDVSRILNYSVNMESTLYGYQIIDHTCPIFVTYNKRDDITANTKYEDQFLTPQRFSWMTRSNVRLSSTQIPKIMSNDTRRLLFVKKSDAEGGDFYYMGDVQIAEDPTETTIVRVRQN
jgi:superfamily II DNA or RNA helicase/HKD family nuclease